jgi:tRNA(His) 5'-end guanylyltransferase
MSNDSLGDRQKGYEDAFRHHLPMRMPIMLRIDGKAFHSYLKGVKTPFHQGIVDCMNVTAKHLCEHIQGAQIAYVQSDEISILINNYKELNSQAWFQNNIQKMVSVAASMAGVIFTMNSDKIWGSEVSNVGSFGQPVYSPIIKPAFFDARAFVIPQDDVCNAFLWRQQDATRNSVQMLARSLYSHKECTDKNNSELQEMCFQKGVNWNDCPTSQKRGRCIVKSKSLKQGTNPKTGETFMAERSEWVVDDNIPIFSQDRNYINQYVYPKKEIGIQPGNLIAISSEGPVYAK